MFKRIFETMFSSLRARSVALWNKIRLFFSPSFWQTKVIAKCRQFFANLFNVRPKDQHDYYTVFAWLVSKRLAYALVVALCVGCILLLSQTLPDMVSSRGESAMPTYRYNSALLKFYNGQARVTAHDGHVAYVGAVEDGAAKGQGALYNKDQSLVYEGSFDNSKYNGEGTQYYPGSGICYTGHFVDNLYDGTGKFFRPSGVLEYEGAFSRGKRMGAGKLYDASGNLIYTGNFRDNDIVFDELLGKTMEEAALIYSGKQTLYMTDDESCIDMKEIGVLCGLKDGSDSLEPEWAIDTVFVPSSSIVLDGIVCTTIEQVATRLGTTEYEGETPVQLSEAIVIDQMTDDAALRFDHIDMETQTLFEEVLQVVAYDQSYPAYVYSFAREGVLYTFYTGAESETKFDFYAITRVA